ncbi:MAG: hypothetical protein DYG93_02510 [Leptolyngbya sp. PLA2]|nr:hypothetical protein [Leptolyngbya sp. PL-A2]MCQ3940479.1 hypothetical protein [cyanobacterium CYA1]MCZ7633944.1 hypothetical protein [Phycisphaerales bacterium]MDL1904329.1 hypothetical protein [Synechococcales cyanobacterium CNB]GIK19560.1 MAG: hypothetical protein BroJett004_17240 [Planctomycetota bacterium]
MPARLLSLCIAAACVMSACTASGPSKQTTRLRHSDLALAGAEMREQLATATFLEGRTPESPPIRIVIRRLENLSSDRVPIAEQWAMVSGLIADRGVQQAARERGVVFQLPPEKASLLRETGVEYPDLLPEHYPTHVLRASIRSLVRGGAVRGSGPADVRKDVYLISYEVEEIDSREVVWQADVEFAREAKGLLVD